MKAKEIRGMDRGLAVEKMAEMKKELIKLNAQIAVGTAIKNPGQVRKIKKALARIKTIQHEKVGKHVNVKKPEADKKS